MLKGGGVARWARHVVGPRERPWQAGGGRGGAYPRNRRAGLAGGRGPGQRREARSRSLASENRNAELYIRPHGRVETTTYTMAATVNTIAPIAASTSTQAAAPRRVAGAASARAAPKAKVQVRHPPDSMSVCLGLHVRMSWPRMSDLALLRWME